MEICVNYLGEPELFLDGKRLVIRQKMLLALFLLLLFHGHCSREEIISKLWCGYSPEDSKRNLRNGLYKLKYEVGSEVVLTKGKNYLFINPQITVIRDIDIFITDNNEELLLNLDKFVFLDKFSLHRCPEFEEWQTGIQRIYEKMLLERLEAALKNSEKVGHQSRIERFSEKILKVEPYNETALESLMRLNLRRHKAHKAIVLYRFFETKLQEDLGVHPSEVLQHLYKSALGSQQRSSNGLGNLDQKLHKRSQLLTEEYQHFGEGRTYRHIVVCGPIGVGKSYLISEFLKNANVQSYLELDCNALHPSLRYYAAEELLLLLNKELGKGQSIKPFPQPADALSYVRSFQMILRQMKKTGVQIILLIRQMEYMDPESLSLLFSVFSSNQQSQLFFICEYCPSFSNHKQIFQILQASQQWIWIPLEYWSETETAHSLRNALDSEALEETLPAIFKYTQGAPLILKEVAQQIQIGNHWAPLDTGDAAARFEQAYSNLPEDQRRVMDSLSLFEYGAEPEALDSLLGVGRKQLLTLLDTLYAKEFLIDFYYYRRYLVRIAIPWFRDLLYSKLPRYKLIELHKVAALYYEEQYRQNPRDYFVLSELKRHYSRTHLEYEKLFYTFTELQYRLDYTDEFFPTLKTLNSDSYPFFTNRDEIYNHFQHYEQQLNRLDNVIPIDQFSALKMQFYFLLGRTLTRDGKRNQGIAYIRELAHLAQDTGSKDYLIKAYIETILYGLKCDDVEIMSLYIKKAKQMDGIEEFEEECGVLFRLEGLAFLIKREYENAEKSLQQSIALFDTPRLRNRNIINMAAAYDYLGLLHRNKGEYPRAESYFLKAIQTCEARGISKSLDLFYADLGYNYFLEKNYSKAESFLEKSLQLYDEFGTYWLRSIVESCMAMIQLKKGCPSAALEHYRRAGIFSLKDAVKEELDVLEKARKALHQQGIL